MPFFQRIRRAFGLDNQEYYNEDEEQGIDATVVPLRRRPEEQPQNSADSTTPPAQHADTADCASKHAAAGGDALAAADHTVPVEIFKTVVDVFNKSLPDFLGESVDAARQQKFLYDALDDGMKKYLESLDREARRRYDEMRHADMLKTDTELHELRQALKRQEDDSDELKKSQLSAERQKRALNERVRDLEKQINTLQAEAEQLDLENKSLVNKLRINSLQEKDIEALRADTVELQEQISRLTAENTTLKESIEQAKMRETLGDTMVSDLQGRASAAIKALSEKEKEMAALLAEKNDIMGELAEMQTLRDELQATHLRATTAEKAVADNAAAADELRRQIEDLRSERDEARTLVEANAQQLAKAREKLTIITEIQTQVEQLEEARLKTDAQIRRHKDELLEKDELIRQKESDISDKNIALFQKDATIKRLEDLCDSLRKQIEEADFRHAEMQSALQSEINRLKRLPATDRTAQQPLQNDIAVTQVVDNTAADTPATYTAATHNEPTLTAQPTSQPTVKAGAIDDLIDNLPIVDKQTEPAADATPTAAEAPARRATRRTSAKTTATKKTETNEIPPIDDDNWLIPTPPRSSRQKQSEASENDDFGYKEPPRRPESDNPAQMSLF